MKKIIGILLVSVIILSLAACRKVSSNEISSISSNDNTVSEIEKTNDIISSDITEQPVVSSEPQTTGSSETETTHTQSSIVSSEPVVSVDTTVETDDNSSMITIDFDRNMDIWFTSVYNLTEQQYILQLKSELSDCQTELAKWDNLYEQYTAEKTVEKLKLQEQFANMGLLNSGQYKAALSNLDYKYNQKISECKTNISTLNSKIPELEAEIENPNPYEILATIAVENGYTADQVVDYYNKYIVE